LRLLIPIKLIGIIAIDVIIVSAKIRIVRVVFVIIIHVGVRIVAARGLIKA
jgi:hypothetical protein